MTALLIVTALGFGLIAGAFFVFSAMVMPALRRLPADQGAAAMQAINIAAINPVFLGALFAPAGLGLAIAVWAPFRWDEPGMLAAFLGSLLYVVGTIVLTIAFNVPRNNALARLDPRSPDAAAYWPRYLREWTAGNHVRGAAALAAAALLTVAACA